MGQVRDLSLTMRWKIMWEVDFHTQYTYKVTTVTFSFFCLFLYFYSEIWELKL